MMKIKLAIPRRHNLRSGWMLTFNSILKSYLAATHEGTCISDRESVILQGQIGIYVNRYYQKYTVSRSRKLYRWNRPISHIACNERRKQRLSLGNACGKFVRLPNDRPALGIPESQCLRGHFLGVIPDCGTMRRFHDILHILKRSLDHASGRTDMGFC